MKKISLVFFFAITLSMISCKKNENNDKDIHGTWKLISTMADPGDGSGVYTVVKGPVQYVTFLRSGKIVAGDLVPASGFKVLDNERIEFSPKVSDKSFVYYYKLKGDSLELNPPCIEGCGLRFRRM